MQGDAYSVSSARHFDFLAKIILIAGVILAHQIYELAVLAVDFDQMAFIIIPLNHQRASVPCKMLVYGVYRDPAILQRRLSQQGTAHGIITLSDLDTAPIK